MVEASAIPADDDKRPNDAISLATLLRPLGSHSESVRPFMPVLGGPRLYLLMLYAAVVIGSSIEFFMSQEIWYGNWEVYNTYVFTVAGFFVLMGVAMLFLTTGKAPAEEGTIKLPIPKPILWYLGLFLVVINLFGLAGLGSDLGGWAVMLSVLALGGFVMMIMGMKSISNRDSVWLAVYGFALVLLVLMPVHEAFDVARSAPGDYPFTGLNLVLLAFGMSFALISLQFIKTRDGYLGAWVMGAMTIFLLAFHEQAGILSSGGYEPYDRALALIGVVFSFLPLVMYLWREKEYLSIWSKLRRANHMIHSGDYPGALVQADASVREASAAGVSHKFSLPWNMKGDVLYHMKEYSKAKSNYDIALEIDPEDCTTWCHLGNMYAFEGKRALALSAFDRSIQADPKNSYAWNNKGVVFTSLDWPEEALVCFNRAVALDPKNFDAFVNLAKTGVKLGRSDDAVLNYQKALAIKPHSKVAKEGLQREFYKGMCLDQIRGWEQMGLDTSTLRSILSQDPANFEKRSKEFLSSIVEQRTQLVIGGGQGKLDINAAIKAILNVASSSEKGATLERIMKDTNLTNEQLVLPIALLMKTNHLHFKRSGTHNVYVGTGKVPEKPALPSEPAADAKLIAKRKERRARLVEESIEPTASVLHFGRSTKKKGKSK
ncbi:MAG: tetratricopeptide repeat protein [Methanomassiliicoccus sp.]|nr:MAG: tetratricopeptide repeat protein [Methanomassiliicoccus sp.]